MEYKNIERILLENREEKYQKFASALLPNVDNVLGVRLPFLRKLAKRIFKESGTEYLRFKTEYFEEVLLQAFIIGLIDKPYDEIKMFIPKIDNWSICDSFVCSLKFIKKNKEDVWEFIQTYLMSDKEFEIRFGLVVLLNYYIEENYLDKIFEIIENVKLEDYYAQMGCAWLVSICYKKYPEETKRFLDTTKIDEYTRKKSLQKIRELRNIILID